MNRRVVFGTCAVLALAAAAYCFMGYAMTASFSVATGNEDGRYDRPALLWSTGMGASLLAAAALAIAAWRQGRKRI